MSSEGGESSKGPSKFKVGTLAFTTFSDLKKLMEGDPLGAVGLLGDAGKWSQLLVPSAIATPVIQGGLYVLMATSASMGEGSPDGGGAFSDGAKLFQSNGKNLESAYPTETWSGSASDAYTAQNSHQIQRATTMLEADNDIVRILSTQAQQVDNARREVDWASKGLAAVIPVAMALEATVLGAPESIALQIAAVATASGFAGLTVGNLMNYVQDNAAQIREATEKYRQVGAAPSTGSTASPSDSGSQTEPDNPGTPPVPSNPGSPGGPTSTGDSGGQSGDGSGSGSGSGSGGGSGAGSGSPATPTMPSTTGMPSGATNAASTGAGMGGMPSLPQMGGGSGSGGGGILGGLAGAAGQVAQAVTQAVQQADQQEPNEEKVGETGDGQPETVSEQSGAAAGAESHAGRAPIHASFDTGATNAAVPQHLPTGL
ncbi:EspA/EspE family type VII secretion system effector [Mycolicibacterium lutetiense]|uniref:Uncharacterized protein YukE n=1 Tax=Mycolicibacterium lutetiense TaxID=1641992 RepID=A0ABS4ZP83_9MYCO|nr:EspA/EspE family type VII secretion system effector [Mycolicibacterium lutetiense]MBP2451326.1 uncharacterized protein YukE [Mycolicibacterium lutetiense]